MNSSYREDGSIVIASGDRLTIENAAEFARLIREALEVVQHVSVEFDEGVVLDITGIQILRSACKTAAARGKIFSYHCQQLQGLGDMITSCGLENRLACKYNTDATCIWSGGTQ
ncbi:hypothetical protein [Pelotalea chapellei]|uniref:STAS domain-containing protein n=1 Tax=Pelotalea chapellei TaxID=44671 RepID=A0ABS5U4D6_9BACT|nr:hypothetical protein [Pelotalea chapellei]MBT1070532.1 hypothetical protein [Pelotalea chapellei]